MRPSNTLPIDPDCVSKISRNRQAELSRRNFLQCGTSSAVALGVVAAIAGKARAQQLARRFARVKADPSTARIVPLDPALLKLIDRTTFGFNRDTYDQAALVGYDAFLEQQLDYESIDDSAMDAYIASYETLSMSAQEI